MVYRERKGLTQVMYRRLFSNGAWMLVGTVIYALCQWGQLNLVSRFGTGTDLGIFTLSIALATPVYMFFSFQLRTIQVTDVESSYGFNSFLVLRCFSGFLALTVVLGVVWIIKIEESDALVLVSVCCVKMVEGISEIYNSRLQILGRVEKIAISFSLKGMASIAGMYVGLLIFGGLLYGILISLMLLMLVVVLYDYLMGRRVSDTRGAPKPTTLAAIKHILFKGLPLGLVMLLVALNANVPKYVADYLLGRELQGIYSALVYFYVLGNLLISSVGQVAVPMLAKLYKDKEYLKFKKVSFVFCLFSPMVGVVAAVVSYFGGPALLEVALGERFSPYASILFLLLLSSIFLYLSSSLGFTLTAMREFSVQPKLNLAVLCIAVPVNYYLAKMYGMAGLAYAAMVVFGLQSLLVLLVIKLRLRAAEASRLLLQCHSG